MIAATSLDREAIAQACERFGVARLRVFGSILTDRFDPATSDVDFLVDFKPGVARPRHADFTLKDELERIVGDAVDLVVADCVRNPYCAASIFGTAVDVSAA